MRHSFGPVDDRSRQQLAACVAASEPDGQAVLCADHHPGYSMPIGGVLGLRRTVIPAGVGYDIACGNCAVRTNVAAGDVDVARVMDEVVRQVSFGIGRANSERVDHPVLDAIAQSPVAEQRGLAKLAQDQLGTVGSGNHYVDLLEDRADGQLWVGVHFGSRGFGHKTASGFLAVAAGKTFEDRVAEGDMDAAPLTLSLDQPSGWDYLAAMELAGQYAYAGREWVVARVLAILGATETDRVHNHHNYAWWEEHDGARLLVIRKGATPAFPGQRGFVGGTMGDDAVILEGRDTPAARAALYSTVHGAGRVMSRRQAAGRTRHESRWRCQDHRRCDYSAPKGGYHKDEGGPTPRCPQCGHKLRLTRSERRLSPGAVDWPRWQAELAARGVELRGGGADEAPECYKRLEEVLAHHEDTVVVRHRLRPVGVAMAPREVFDPYKD